MGQQKKSFIQKTPKKSTSRRVPLYLWFMPLCIVIYGLLYLSFGEIIVVNQGCGWDGCWFRDCAAYGSAQITNKQLSPYRVQRILPSMIVHYISYYLWQIHRATNILSYQHPLSLIFDVFRVYNFMLLIIAAWLWGLIARHLSLKTLVAWTGFSLVFGNFAILKYSFYYPPLTDTSAFFIGIFMLYAYLLNRSLLLLLAIIVGFWTWQTTAFVGIFLYLFPRELSIEQSLNQEQPFHHTARRVIALCYGFALMIFAWVSMQMGLNFGTSVEQPFVPLVYLCMLVLMMYGAYTLFFTSTLFSLRGIIHSVRRSGMAMRLISILSIMIALYGLKIFAQNPDLRSEMELLLFLGGTFSAAVAKPLIGVVANTVFFGIPLLLVLILLPRLIPIIRTLGLGFSIIFSLTLLLSVVMTESRQLVNMIPFFIVPCCLLFQFERFTIANALPVIGLTFLWSQSYLKLNIPQMQELSGVISTYSQFPMQTYFRFHGPWMGMEAYIWTGIATVATACTLIFLLRPIVKLSKADFQ